MAGATVWRAGLKRNMTRKRLKKDNVEPKNLHPLEIEYLEKVLDQGFPMMNLKNDIAFWRLMGTNNDFNSSVVVTIVSSHSAYKMETFFNVIFMKVKAGEIFQSCLQKMYNKFIDALVAENNVPLLENLFEINFQEWKGDDFDPKMENLPALVKACMSNNYDIVKVLVANGFLLR